VTGNISFRFLSNPFLKAFFEKLRPSYKLPTEKHTMPKVLIPAEYVRVKKSVDDALKSSDFLSISSDGWTDVNDTPIINFIIHAPKPYLFSSIDTTGKAHSGDYICEKISEVFACKKKKRKIVFIRKLKKLGRQRLFLWSPITPQI